MKHLELLTIAVAALALPAVASAQGGAGGVANSGMGQGEARISARSDIRLSMESMPGTSGASVSALGTRVGQRMSQLRTCYSETVAENPGIEGTLRMRVVLGARGRPAIEVDQDGVNDRSLVRCITGVLQAVECDGLRRPTRAIVQLEMGNSAAAGAERVRVRAQQARQVAITIDSDGNPSSTGGTPDGRVRFVATGQGRESVPAVTAAHRVLLGVLPGLMDCRRRAARQRMNQEGTIAVRMQIRANRPVASVVGRSTVEDERARRCVRSALQRSTHRPEAGSGVVNVQVQFAGPDAAPAD